MLFHYIVSYYSMHIVSISIKRTMNTFYRIIPTVFHKTFAQKTGVIEILVMDVCEYYLFQYD